MKTFTNAMVLKVLQSVGADQGIFIIWKGDEVQVVGVGNTRAATKRIAKLNAQIFKMMRAGQLDDPISVP